MQSGGEARYFLVYVMSWVNLRRKTQTHTHTKYRINARAHLKQHDTTNISCQHFTAWFFSASWFLFSQDF